MDFKEFIRGDFVDFGGKRKPGCPMHVEDVSITGVIFYYQ